MKSTSWVVLLVSIAAFSAGTAYGDILMQMSLTDLTGAVNNNDSDSFPVTPPPMAYDLFPSVSSVGLFDIGFTTAGSIIYDGHTWNLHLHLDITNTDTEPRDFEVMLTAQNLALAKPALDQFLNSGIGGVAEPPPADAVTTTFLEGFDAGNGAYSFPVATTNVFLPLGGSPFSAAQTKILEGPFGGDYSLSERITIENIAPGQNVSFDTESLVFAVPEPVSITLLGLGAAGLFGYIRRRRVA